jgi:predicted porin
MLDVGMAASESFTIGGQFYYAAGDDEDRQYTYLGNDFNGYDPLFDLGTSLHDEQIMASRPFDLGASLVGLGLGVDKEDPLGANTSTGVVGGRLYVGFKASDALNLGASAAYMTPEEDKNFKGFDSASFYAAGATYALMANTSIHAQVEYVDVDTKSKIDSAFLTGVGLFVNF